MTSTSGGVTDFFDQCIDMLCIAGMDGYFKSLNAAWTSVTGYSKQELMSRPYLDFVHPDDRGATEAEAGKLSLGFPTVHFRNRYACKDGSYRWLAWTATPAVGDGLIYAGARDVTDEIADASELERLRDQRRVRVEAALSNEDLSIVMQPIVQVSTGRVCGFEALSRFTRKPVRTPDQWFAEAAEVGLGTDLELLAIRKATAANARLPNHCFLSINASPVTLENEDFHAAASAVKGERLVVEVTEHAAVDDYGRLRKAMDRLRRSGVRMAIDDAGAGFSSLKHIVTLVPDFIKLDLFLIRDVDSDPVKRALAAAMVSFAGQIDARLIAEGVETKAEFDTLKALGVNHAQGYFLGRPRATI